MSDYGKNWKKFLDKEENAWMFDFRFEAEGWAEKKSDEGIKNAVKKFTSIKDDNLDRALKYKASRVSFDPDRCALARSIYKALWHVTLGKDKVLGLIEARQGFVERWNNLGLGINSDTMNTFKTTYNQVKDKKNLSDNGKLLSTFAGLTQTLGSFTLIPHRLKSDNKLTFNSGRGFWRKDSIYYVCDYWDLSLKLIKDILGEDFFIDYIDTFHLKTGLDKNCNEVPLYVDKNYNIFPLIPNHGIYLKDDCNFSEELKKMGKTDREKAFLPAKGIELNDFLEMVNIKIEARGRKLISLLREKSTR